MGVFVTFSDCSSLCMLNIPTDHFDNIGSNIDVLFHVTGSCVH